MDNNPSTSSGRGNNFFSGFLLGALIGAAAVFLLGTKKGKKILKAISEEGEGKISNILDKIENSVDLQDEFSEDEEVVAPKKEIAKKVIVEEKPPARNASASVAGGKVRRFFRGISRHVN